MAVTLSSIRSQLPRTLAAAKHPLRASPIPLLTTLSSSSSTSPQAQPFSSSTALLAAPAAKSKKAQPGRKKASKWYSQTPPKALTKFALCDAMRYLQAFEVGYPANSPKYELAVRMHTFRNGPVIRSFVRLPNFVRQDIRLCVICPPGSVHAEEAKAAGAVLIGEEEVFEEVRAGRINFDRCIAHESSLTKLNQADIAKLLGPKRLMPTLKRGTVVTSVKDSLNELLGTTAYTERAAVVRLPIGQLSFTPEQLRDNVQTFMTKLKQDIDQLDDSVPKEIYEVVLSSSHGPGFSLNGNLRSESSLPVEQLTFSLDSEWGVGEETPQEAVQGAAA